MMNVVEVHTSAMQVVLPRLCQRLRRALKKTNLIAEACASLVHAGLWLYGDCAEGAMSLASLLSSQFRPEGLSQPRPVLQEPREMRNELAQNSCDFASVDCAGWVNG